MRNWHAAVASVVMLGVSSGVAPSPAAAGVVVTKNQRAGWFTVGEIAGTGTPGDTVKVKFSNGSTKTATVQAGGGWSIGLTSNEPSGAATVTESDGETAGITVALGFTPPSNQVKTAFTVLPGSALSIGGQSFTLSGSFTTLDTDVDYNNASPNFGKLSGSVLASPFDVSGSGAPGIVTIGFGADQPYTVDMLPLWDAATLDGGVAVPLNVSLSGTLDLAGIIGSFAGTVSGTDTFFPDATEDLDVTVNLNSDFGGISGTFFAHGDEELVMPEPSAVGVIAVGAAALILVARGRRRRSMLV